MVSFKNTDMKKMKKKRSFKNRLIVSFCLVSIIPIILLNFVSYYNIAVKVQENVDELKQFIEETKNNLMNDFKQSLKIERESIEKQANIND